MKNKDFFDVVIIGAGPSGSNAAISYKKLNSELRVAVVDKETFPRDKSRGDAIGPGVINALKRFDNEHILEDDPQVVSTTLFGPKNIGIHNYIPKVKNKEDSIVYVIPRFDLDNRIFNLAKEAGVETFEGHRYINFTHKEDSLIIELENENKKKLLIETKLLIGADGANSRVRKSLNLKQNSDWNKAIAIRAYIDSSNYIEIFNERTLMFEINVSALKGYAWAFPSKGDLVNIGIGVPLSLFKKEKMDIKLLLGEFIATLKSRGVNVENLRMEKSFLLPFASSRPKLAHNRIALIGDAGSMINPMSGEGIFYGMEAGYIVAQETYELITQSSSEINLGIEKYEKVFNKRFGKHFLSCSLARIIFQSPFMTKRLLSIASTDQHTIDFVVELLFDEANLTVKETLLLVIKFFLPLNILKLLRKTSI
mgnify:CR=1 FL=1